ncbi:MAG: hypothetical protein WBP60_10275 [Gammaproteobacteria bacterium]
MSDHSPNLCNGLLVGTRKGLFRLCQDSATADWELDGPHIPGYEVIHACVAPRNPGLIHAAVFHPVWGAHIYCSKDYGEHWEPLSVSPHFADDRHGDRLKSVWFLAWSPDGDALYAGIDPAGLFVSRDAGASWLPVDGLNQHPTRDRWEAAKGIFAVHSICIDPQHPDHIAVAVSAGGVYLSRDGGRSWQPSNAGVRAENLPEPAPIAGHNVHRLIMHPRSAQRLYRQCYNGSYRSDDGGQSWIEITTGLPSDFGYAIATPFADPDTVFQIPESGSHLRTAVDGKLRVFRSRDGGRNWESASAGLPQQHAYVTVLREAIDTDHAEGVYFGTSSGHLFASADSGEHWRMIAGFLPRILCVLSTPLPSVES